MPEQAAQAPRKGEIFDTVSVNLRVCVGTARPSLQELVSLQSEAVLHLDKSVSDEVELFVGERLIAKGVLEENQDAPGDLQVRVTSVGPD